MRTIREKMFNLSPLLLLVLLCTWSDIEAGGEVGAGEGAAVTSIGAGEGTGAAGVGAEGGLGEGTGTRGEAVGGARVGARGGLLGVAVVGGTEPRVKAHATKVEAVPQGGLLGASGVGSASGGEALALSKLSDKNFQLNMLRSLHDLAEQRAELSLNDYLLQLEGNTSNYGNYTRQLAEARAAIKLQPKVLLIKQLLDAQQQQQQHVPVSDMEHTCVLRNLLFLSRLHQQLRDASEASTLEIRQLRLHRLCLQFERPRQHREQRGQRLINEATVGAALKQLNLTQATGETNESSGLSLNHFGQQLYDRVKLSGAAIIDNYLLILRGLLQDILDAAYADLAENTTRLERLLSQLDTMLTIPDFFEKRQSVYAFLEHHLTPESDRTVTAEQQLTEQLLEQLKAKGLDLFVIFLFSNFEFLELVHEHWQQLLPQSPSLLYDETQRQLYDIQQLYEAFKLDTESSAKYTAYTKALRQLYERTVEQGQAQQPQQQQHIFEMVNNAAQNVGSVSFNMIKAKCKELL